MDLLLAVAGEELEVWAASEVEAETELKGQVVEAAWEAVWVMGPAVSLQVQLQEVALQAEDLKKGDEREETEENEGLKVVVS